MPFATARNARIHYTVHGDRRGTPVVLLQGLGLSSRFWFDVPELLSEDAETPRRVIAVDNRGTGRSDKPRTPWTMSTMADDVAAVLDDAGVEGAFVVGISMGGMIAQHVALRHPTRVKGLVLLATTAGFLMGALPEAKALAREIGSRGITVNAVAPGYVKTAMTDRLTDEQRKGLTDQIALGRLGEGDDVAGAVVYLASPAAAYVTGTCLNVSGGLFIG